MTEYAQIADARLRKLGEAEWDTESWKYCELVEDEDNDKQRSI